MASPVCVCVCGWVWVCVCVGGCGCGWVGLGLVTYYVNGLAPAARARRGCSLRAPSCSPLGLLLPLLLWVCGSSVAAGSRRCALPCFLLILFLSVVFMSFALSSIFSSFPASPPPPSSSSSSSSSPPPSSSSSHVLLVPLILLFLLSS